jgi:hypothetical protein
MQLLRKSTAAVCLAGPMLDLSGLPVNDATVADFSLEVNGTLAPLDALASAAHVINGHYAVGLTASDSGQVGRLAIIASNGDHAMPPARYQVLEQAVFDATFGPDAISPTDAGAIAAALYQKIAAGSVTVLERPAVADPLDVVNSADFAAQLYVPSAASSTLVFTIRRCADDVVAQLEADSYAGLTIAPGTFTAGQAEVVRVSSERVDVGIAAAVLSQLAPGKYFAELRELTDGAAVRSLWEAALIVRRSAGRRIA